MLNMPVSAIRTKLRQEFERHRYVNQLKTVDVLIFQSSAEFQVRKPFFWLYQGRQRGCKVSCAGVASDGNGADRGSRIIGDDELLEAGEPCYEVLQGGGRSEGEITAELHQRVLGGT